METNIYITRPDHERLTKLIEIAREREGDANRDYLNRLEEELERAEPRDGLMLGLSRKTGWSLHLSRTALEISVLVAGWLLGGAVGVGTVLIALTIGPVIQIMSRMTGEELGRANRLAVNIRACCDY